MADKLEKFDKKETEWKGLWYHPEYGGFSSEAINLSKLKEFKGTVRVYVRKNKFYKKGSKAPNYSFCIKDSKAEIFTELDVTECNREYAKKDENGYWRTSDGERLYTRKEVQHAINCAAKDGARGYDGDGDNIVEDYL